MANSNENFSEQQRTEFREVFEIFDKVGDGKIAPEQLANVLRCLGLNPLASDVERFERIKGRISVEHFWQEYQAMTRRRSPVYEDFVEGLRAFDHEANGLINTAELRNVLCNLGDRLKMEEAEDIVSLRDDKGKIEYEKLVKDLMSQ